MTLDPLTLTMNAAPLTLSIGEESLTLSLGASIGGSATARRGRLVELDASATLPVTGAGNTYVNTGGAITATLPASGTIVGDAVYDARFIVTVAELFTIAAQGSDVIRYYGVEGASMAIAERDAVLEIAYVGGGVFVATFATREWEIAP